MSKVQKNNFNFITLTGLFAKQISHLSQKQAIIAIY